MAHSASQQSERARQVRHGHQALQAAAANQSGASPRAGAELSTSPQALLLEQQHELQRRQQAELEAQQHKQRERMKQLHLQQQQELQKELARQQQWSFAQAHAQVQSAAAQVAAQARMCLPPNPALMASASASAAGMGGHGLGLPMGFGITPPDASTIAAAVAAVKEEIERERSSAGTRTTPSPHSAAIGSPGLHSVPSLERGMESLLAAPQSPGGRAHTSDAEGARPVRMDTDCLVNMAAGMGRRAGSAPVLSRMHSSRSVSLSRLGDASSSGALGGNWSGAASGDEDGTMEDWMFDIESVDAAIAAGATAASKAMAVAAAATGDAAANHLRINAAAAAAMRTGSLGSIDTGGITSAGRVLPPLPAAAQPLGFGGHMSMSAHDISTMAGPTTSTSPIADSVRTAVARPAGGATAMAGSGAGTDTGAAAGPGEGAAAGNPAQAEAGAGLHFDMSLSELETFDFDLYDD